jgi:hypothetical protein
MISEAFCLHVREMQAEADMRAAAVGHELFVARASRLIGKAQGTERFRLRPTRPACGGYRED